MKKKISDLASRIRGNKSDCQILALERCARNANSNVFEIHHEDSSSFSNIKQIDIRICIFITDLMKVKVYRDIVYT